MGDNWEKYCFPPFTSNFHTGSLVAICYCPVFHRSCTRASRYFGTGFSRAIFKNIFIKVFNISHFRRHSRIHHVPSILDASQKTSFIKHRNRKNILQRSHTCIHDTHTFFSFSRVQQHLPWRKPLPLKWVSSIHDNPQFLIFSLSA